MASTAGRFLLLKRPQMSSPFIVARATINNTQSVMQSPRTQSAYRKTLASLSLLASLALTACSTPYWWTPQQPLDSPIASEDNVQLLQSAGVRPLAVALPSINPPTVPSSAESVSAGTELPCRQEDVYLRDTLQVELQGAAVWDAASRWVLTSQVVDVVMARDHATLAARFSLVSPEGQVAYEREIRTSSSWAPGLGSVGARGAAKGQSAVYRQLVGRLFADPAFRAATQRRPAG